MATTARRRLRPEPAWVDGRRNPQGRMIRKARAVPRFAGGAVNRSSGLARGCSSGDGEVDYEPLLWQSDAEPIWLLDVSTAGCDLGDPELVDAEWSIAGMSADGRLVVACSVRNSGSGACWVTVWE